MKILYLFIRILHFILGLVLIFALGLTVLGANQKHLNIAQYPYLKKALEIEMKSNKLVKAYIPTQFKGKDYSRWITGFLVFILLQIVRSRLDQLSLTARKYIEIKKMSEAQKKEVDSQEYAAFQSKMEQIKSYKPKNKEELLKLFIQTRKELESFGRELAFLAIDIVNSTGMKEGETQAMIEYDFLQYHYYIELKFKEHGYVKASWTPDGVMACFNTVENAIKAAQAILSGLDDFNKNVKTIKSDFHVRCGINAGFVYYDDSMPLEQFSDRTLDIAGHLQKYAQPDSIFIAKQLIHPTKTDFGFGPTKDMIDGVEVFRWSKGASN